MQTYPSAALTDKSLAVCDEPCYLNRSCYVHVIVKRDSAFKRTVHALVDLELKVGGPA